jgi:hypothetical protein
METVEMTQPFDQDLYDALMTHLETWHPMGNVFRGGFTAAAREAARIAAERVPAVSDEDLSDLFLLHVTTSDVLSGDVSEGIRAVRAALGPAVPVIPEGWRLWSLTMGLDGYKAILEKRDSPGEWRHVQDNRLTNGTGHTWLDALNAAIAAARDGAS